MSIGTALVLLITVAVIALLLSALRPRPPRLVNRGRRGGFRRRRIDAIKAAAARDIALIQGNDQALRPRTARDREAGR
jgi:hypothetical protein